MTLKSLSPQDARALLAQGAKLIDIRSADEHSRECIQGATHVPMEHLDQQGLPADTQGTVIFHCRSGNRTRLNASRLAGCVQGEAYALEGGLDAWKKAGLPVQVDASAPLELQRQVQMVAGTLIVLGAVLGALASPWFHLLSAFVGGGLVFAGASGFCGMARLLMHMPWNRRAIAG